MQESYYIAVTVIFGVFILFTLWWLWGFMRKRSLSNMNLQDLNEEQKAMLAKFCEEIRMKATSETSAPDS